MSNPLTLPNQASADTPTFDVKVNGQAISNEYHVMSVEIQHNLNRITWAEIRINDGDPNEQTFTLSELGDFVPGVPIEVHAGYHGTNELIFKGVIYRHSIEARGHRPASLCLFCKHEAEKLTVGRKNAYFYEKTDSAVMEEVLRNGGISSMQVESTSHTHAEMVQFYCTDWDFLLSRAEANGMFVYTEQDQVTIKKPDFGQAPAVELHYSSNIMEFEAEMDARPEYSQVTAYAWSQQSQTMRQVNGTNPGTVAPGNITPSELSQTVGLSAYEIRHGGHLKDPELQAWASARLLKSHLSKIRGRVRFQGFANVIPGNLVAFSGMGERFNGSAFVSGVRHEISAHNWIVDLHFGVDPNCYAQQYKDIQSPPAEGLLPAVNGLQVGVVTKLEEDPDGDDRIRVRLPLIDPSGDGVWARIACLDAGNNRGTYFRPEINDEVVVGFFQDDPRLPVVLGQLNSGNKPAPVRAEDVNHEKGIYTREALKLVFNDEVKSVTIETPGGQKAILTDEDSSITLEDSNGNKIIMNADGITLDSAKDLIFKSAVATNVESGTETKITAGTQAKISGSAGTEVTSSAILKLQGSLVKIN